MRIVFMGSAELACASLRALAAGPGMTVSAVISQPDRPSGRNLEVTRGPVAAAADLLEIPVHTPLRVNEADTLAMIRAQEPDYIAVVAYGQILKPDLLDLPKKACVNVHTSLLPAYRGAAPIQWAIAAGEVETGVTTMFMSAELDAGDILLQQKVPVLPGDTAESLHERLADIGAELLVATLLGLKGGAITSQPQDAAQVSYAPRLKKSDGEIDWTLGASAIYNRVRGFHPWPGCFTRMRGAESRLKIHSVRVESGSGKPGEVIACSGEGPVVAASDGVVRLIEVQPEGKKRMTGSAYLRGHSVRVGDVFG